MTATRGKRDETRAGRVPLSKQNVLVAPERPGFTRYWVNDRIGELEAYELAGWTFVKDPSIKTHDNLSHVESHKGGAIKRVVNRDPNASSRYGYLMEIPTELYNEDMAIEQNQIREEEKRYAEAGNNRPDMYGGVNVTRS